MLNRLRVCDAIGSELNRLNREWTKLLVTPVRSVNTTSLPEAQINLV